MTANPTVQSIFAEMDMAGKINWPYLDQNVAHVLHSILKCHTRACGFTKESCPECHYESIHYGSCNNSSCPMCGVLRREAWAMKQQEYLINALYYHIIFTVPAKMNELFIADPKFMYNLLMNSQRDALQELAADKKFLGAVKTGMISLLHTWGQKMDFHPHVHTLFVAGGFNSDGQWVTQKKSNYLFPVKMLASRFQKYFLNRLGKHPSDVLLELFPDFRTRLWELRNSPWNVQIEEAAADPAYIIQYFARYANRLAISNSRLISYENGRVCFRYKDNKDGGKTKEMTLTDTEFLRRFCMHILPYHFQKRRNYGFMSNVSRKTLIPLIRKITGDIKRSQEKRENMIDVLTRILGREPRVCPKCHHRTALTIDQPYCQVYYSPEELTPLEKYP